VLINLPIDCLCHGHTGPSVASLESARPSPPGR
jgi:hypothetical protein